MALNRFISDAEWAEYAKAIDDFHEDASQQPIIWRSKRVNYNKFGEEKPNDYTDITILGLVQYNQFRSWPINSDTRTGEIDKESILVYLNINYLRSENLTNSEGQFQFQPDLDKFVIDGVPYVSKGDSKTAQVRDHTLLHFLVLKREEIPSGKNAY